MKVLIERINENGSIERDWYRDVEKAYTEYQPYNNNSHWLFIEFSPESPNYKKFAPYGETAINYNPETENIIIFSWN